MIQGREKMPTKVRRESNKPTSAESTTLRERPEGWDDRLRLVGDARFVKVEWSGRDHPCWPLPSKTQHER
jgi:hypothetical protein